MVDQPQAVVWPRLAGMARWARVAALGRTAGLAWLRANTVACRTALDRQRRLASGHPAAEVTAFTTSALLTAASGHPDQARRDLAEAEARLHAGGVAALVPQWEQAGLVCDWVAGDRAAALARAERLAALPPPVPAAVTLALRAEAARKAGRLDAARALAGALDGAVPGGLAAWALAGLEEPAAALARLRTATVEARRDGHRGLLPLLLHRTARIAVAEDEPRIAAEAHAAFADLHTGDPLTRVLAALTEARVTGSSTAGRAARDLAEAAGLTGLIVGDGPEPESGPAEARATGMPTAGRAAPTRDGDPGAVLTPRESELAVLVRAGCTNRQIAEALHLSVKSVEAYLTRVYAKTGCASRLELALALAEGRLRLADRT